MARNYNQHRKKKVLMVKILRMQQMLKTEQLLQEFVLKEMGLEPNSAF